MKNKPRTFVPPIWNRCCQKIIEIWFFIAELLLLYDIIILASKYELYFQEIQIEFELIVFHCLKIERSSQPP